MTERNVLVVLFIINQLIMVMQVLQFLKYIRFVFQNSDDFDKCAYYKKYYQFLPKEFFFQSMPQKYTTASANMPVISKCPLTKILKGCPSVVSKLRTLPRLFNVLICSVLFNWNEERIKDEEFDKHHNELEVIKELIQKKYCVKQEGGKCTCFNCLQPGELEWNIFVEKENLIVWKKEETKHIGEGLYCYKMYGRYDDVTALNFLEAQVDLEYRLTWDDNAVELKTIDSERNTRSDVIYWETKWPALFSNRDYVFNRRYFIDEKRKLVILLNKSTNHPSVPPFQKKQRITEYWSYMVIKPYTDLDKPGIEFSLTYFDNPGIQIPSSMSSYVTVTVMPAFLKRLRDAAVELDKVRKGPSILFDSDESSDGDKRPSKDEPKKQPKKKCPKLPDL